MVETEARIGRYSFDRTDLIRSVIIVSLSVLCIITSALSFSAGTLGIITSQLFFIPIIYASYVSPKRGLYIAAACSIAYQTIGYFNNYPNPVALVSITAEAILFIVIAAMIAFFIEQIHA